MIDKVIQSFDEAVMDVPSGATILIGGMAHFPSNLIAALARKGIRDLTVVSCVLSQAGPSAPRPTSAQGPRDLGADRGAVAAPPPADAPYIVTPGLLSELEMISKGITGFASGMRGTEPTPFESLVQRGLATVELNSQGVLAERVRAGKSGVAAFYTATGVGTPPAEGKEVRLFGGVEYILEHAIHADFAIVRASAADRWGNLVYDQPPSFNHVMAGAATVTIAEVDHVVVLGDLRPEHITTSGVFVDRVVRVPARPMTSWKEPC